MGYDLHITRAARWTGNDCERISIDEWLAYCAQDKEMRVDGYAEVAVPGEGVLRLVSEGLAVWTSYPKNGIGGGTAWFDYRGGRISVKNPDNDILCKMKQIAGYFGARVVGDEGEGY